jgi:hypothetical protein
MADVDAASEGAQARESRELSPQAHAAAEALRRRAGEAHQAGDRASAQILSEHALAAYGRAFVLARLARAKLALDQANQELAARRTALADVDEKHKRVAAEAAALELAVRVAEDAIPLVPNAPAGPERERARLEAAAALGSQARLLCLAARLLQPKKEGLDAQLQRVDALDKTLASTPKVAPIDAAIAVRSSCLTELTEARRPATLAAPASGAADALLAELGRVGSFHPFRDDRGVVVALRGLFDAKGALTPEGAKALEALSRVAKAHPAFPVLVVLHGKSPGAEARKTTVASALSAAGVPRAEAVFVGRAQPVVEPARAGSSARNERVEVVFVAPGG